MNDLIGLATKILADYRLSVLLSKDQIAEPLRAAIGRKASGSAFWKFVADLISCPFCLGVWFALAIVIAARSKLGRFLIGVFAVAGGQDFLQSIVMSRDEE